MMGKGLGGRRSQTRREKREMDKCKILFLAANPQGTTPLALDREIREIEAEIRKRMLPRPSPGWAITGTNFYRWLA